MAGVSDSVFRLLCRENGADAVVTEMISVDGIAFGAQATLNSARFLPQERPVGIQLFGADPGRFHDAAALVAERFQPDFIDLNAGCPVQKVVKKNGGASLLKDINRFAAIVKAMVSAVSIPVTVKLRSGWCKEQWVDLEFVQCAQDCGAAAVTLHPRSQTMFFSGHSYWERIAAVKAAAAIPVIGNGDVTSAADAVMMKTSCGCDGIMIGRGAYGNPWIFSEVKAALLGKEPVCPSAAQRHATVVRHISLYRDQYGEKRAALDMKKHVAWYIKGVPDASAWRDRIFRAASSDELETIVDKIFKAQ